MYKNNSVGFRISVYNTVGEGLKIPFKELKGTLSLDLKNDLIVQDVKCVPYCLFHL